ncbi:PilN domain-containing protein [Thalassotalea piscium]
MAKLAINLFQPELLPERPLLSLSRVVAFWLLLLLLMIAWAVYSKIEADSLSEKYHKITKQEVEQQTLLEELQQKVSRNRANPKLLERLDTLKIVLANKKALHSQLTDQSQMHAAGFSTAMTELAMLHHKEISLEQVVMEPGQLSFSGVAKKPESVPSWLTGFDSSTFLSGKHFTHFSLSENEQGLTSFTVSSSSEQAAERSN